MKATNQEYIDVLAEELDRGKLVVFVGAGISMGSGLPSWSKLVEKYSDRLNLGDRKEDKEYTSEEMLIIPEIFHEKFGKIKYYEVLDEIFGKKMKPNKIHEKLDNLSPNYIITTNYDSLVEDQLNETYTYDVIVKEEELAYSQSNKMIIKMHGDLKSKNIVLKKSDYDNYEKERPLITTFVKSLFTTNTVLFIGYSLNDLNVKGIMNWISEILKDDFRRVYLADLSEPNLLNEYQNEQNKLVNRIFLGDGHEKNKGKLIANFLEKISESKEKINENLKGRFYENLNYLTDNQFKKIIGDPIAQVEWFEDDKVSSVLEKKFVLKELNEINDENIIIAAKSNIIKIQKQTLIEENLEKEDINITNKYNKEILNKLKIERKVENKVVKNLFKFDYEAIEKIMEDNEINNIQLLSYFYVLKGNYDLAKEKLKESIEKEVEIDIKLWNSYIISNIEKSEKNQWENYHNKNKKYYDIDLKKEYHKVFKNIYTDLYEEMFNNITLNQFRDKINDLYEETRTGKGTSYGGWTPVQKSQMLIRDFFNYCFFNGLIFTVYNETREILKEYLEIILISYSYKESNDAFILLGAPNKIKKIDYLSIYVMLQVSEKYLRVLFEEYKIKEIVLDDESLETFVVALKNYLMIAKGELPSNIFIILNKLKLDLKEILEVLAIISDENVLNNLNNDSIKLFYQFINKYAKIIPKENFNDLILKILKIKNRWLDYCGEIFTGVLAYHGYEKKIKISDYYIIEIFLKNNNLDKNLKMKLNFTQIAEKDFTSKTLSESLKSLDEKFDISIYMRLLELKLINCDKKYENKIIEKLNNKFIKDQEKFILANSYNYVILISHIISLNFNNLSSVDFKKKLKKLNNQTLDKCLKKQNYFNLWYYILEPEKFDVSKFEIKDFEMLREQGLIGLLKKDHTKQIYDLLKKHLEEKYEDRFLSALLNFEEKK